MPSVVFYFQMHQPPRLRRYTAFDTDPDYFDAALNRTILKRVADRCYRPVLARLRSLVERHGGRFRFSMGITGILLEQLREHEPDVAAALGRLVRMDGVEMVNETSHHSLAFVFGRDEFAEQAALHAQMVEELSGKRPTAFRNTEMIYSNALAGCVASMGGYRVILAEGSDGALAGRPSGEPYRAAVEGGPTVLTRDYKLSDDIGFRFGNRGWTGWPLTAEKFARTVNVSGQGGRLCNVFIDLESIGEHHGADTGVFEFLDAVPAAVLGASRDNNFMTVTEAADAHDVRDTLDCPRFTSWADTERDLSAWLGNAMQTGAEGELYRLEAAVKASGDTVLLRDWRNLTASDHCYYMCTKFSEDMAIHKYFSPYASPYDGYINFMNVLDDVRRRIG